MRETSSRSGFSVLGAGVRGAVRGLLAALLILSAGGCVSVDLLSSGASAPLEESVVRGTSGPKILLVDIDGVIGGLPDRRSFFGGQELSTIARVREVLDRARADADVKALLLRIDSPGGTVTASDQVYTEILRFKKERDVPVVAQLLGTAASGGYYIAMAADEVQAHPTTVTGSIGVIFSSVNVVGLMDKLGIEDQTVKGGAFKDAGSPLRRLTTEERGQLQSIVDDLHGRFREVVAKGRPNLTEAEVVGLANGRIYSARQALENGLVDRLGTLEDAAKLLESRIGTSESRVVAYHRPIEIRRNLYMKAPGGLSGQAAANGLAASGSLGQTVAQLGLARILSRPGFHYLWWPGLID
jgi:protease-4